MSDQEHTVEGEVAKKAPKEDSFLATDDGYIRTAIFDYMFAEMYLTHSHTFCIASWTHTPSCWAFSCLTACITWSLTHFPGRPSSRRSRRRTPSTSSASACAGVRLTVNLVCLCEFYDALSDLRCALAKPSLVYMYSPALQFDISFTEYT